MNENENIDNENSIIVVSNDNISQKIQVNKTTNFENFCQQIVNQFQDDNIINLFHFAILLNVISFHYKK